MQPIRAYRVTLRSLGRHHDRSIAVDRWCQNIAISRVAKQTTETLNQTSSVSNVRNTGSFF